MRLIAVTCQNARTVTPHAGRCRRFFLFGDGGGPMVGTVELLPEEVLHAGPLGPEHPLAPIKVLISAGMGQDLYQRLSARGIQVYLTQESSPEMAVRLYLAGVPRCPATTIAAAVTIMKQQKKPPPSRKAPAIASVATGAEVDISTSTAASTDTEPRH